MIPPVLATGVIRSGRIARVSAPVAGRVVRVIPKRYSVVTAGQTLVELDDQQTAQALRQEKAALESIRLKIAQAREFAEHLRLVAQRYDQLLASGLISAISAEETRTNFHKQVIEVQILEKQAQSQEVAVERVREQLNQCAIRAPIGGIVTDLFVTPSQFVAPTGTGDQASTLLIISDTSDLFAQLSVDEIDVARINVGQTIDLMIDALPREAVRGRIRQVARTPSAQPTKPGVTFEVEVALESPPPGLRIGMSSFAVIPAGQSSQRYLPVAAVQRSETHAWVWTVEQGNAHRKTVELGEQIGDRVLLRRGLEEGASVLCAAPELLQRLVEGQKSPLVQ